MLSFSPSRILLAAGASLVVALSGWYEFSPAFRDKDMQVPMNPQPLSLATETSAAPLRDSGKEDGPRWAEIAALQQEVSLLRGDLAALRGQFQAQADQISAIRAVSERSPAPPSSKLGNVTAHEFTDPVAAKAQEAALVKEENERSLLRAQTNEMEFSTQAVDTAWAGEVNGLIQEAFASAKLKDTWLGGVQCRTTLCRVEVAHQDFDKRAQFERYLPFMVTAQFSSMAMHTTENGDGSSSTVVYLARDGYPLPQDKLSN